MRVENTATMFTSAYERGQLITMPVAHGDGRYTADRNTLDELEGEGRVVLRYVDDTGEPTTGANPNGAERNIAGIVNEQGNVFGMMPHPERAMDDLIGSRHGIGIFQSILSAVPA
jgi:phosphoribosylformylglycinamidine synthase